MPYIVRTSISIGGNRLNDNLFSRVSVRQRIGAHHDFEIRLRQDANRGVLTDKANLWIGKPMNLGFDFKADERLETSPIPDSFIGIVTSISLSRRSGTEELVVNGQSPTIITDDGLNTRSFTEKRLQEIVDEVLGPYKSKFSYKPVVQPKAFIDSLPYIVQYKESNFSFIARLANRYGDWFYYDGLEFYFGKPAGEKAILLDFGEAGLSYFDLSVRAIPTKFELRGYDYTINKSFKEEAPLTASSSSLGKGILGITTREVFTQTPSLPVNTYLDDGEFKSLVKRREQVSVGEIVVMQGSSRNPKLKLGAKIEVKDAKINEKYGIFTITSLTHDIGQGGDYINHFEAISEEVATPPLTAMSEPPFCETQLAEVTDVDDDKQLGRVRVKFLWQEGTDEKTPWIRVASPYTGKDKGFYIVPEVGDQVLVAFENNHPDKPYVLTGMYNGEAKPEWFDPKNKFKGFKSRGGNKWKIDDQKKEIQIHAPSSILMTAGETIAIRSGKKGDDSSIVMKEGKEITVKTNGKADSTIMVDAGEGTVIIKAKKITIEATDLIEAKSGKEVKISGTQKIDAGGAQVNIKGSAVVDVKGAVIKLN